MAKFVSSKGFQMGIAVGKNRIKQYIQKNKNNQEQVRCYLKGGSQFQIYLKNHRESYVIVQLKINGKAQGQGILMDPKEGLYLDRFVTDSKKLVFNTFQMSQQLKELIQEKTSIGEITVEIYSIKSAYDGKVQTVNLPNYNLLNANTSFNWQPTTMPPVFLGTGSMGVGGPSVSTVYAGSQPSYAPHPAPTEQATALGCIEQGAVSNQGYDIACDWVTNRLLESYKIVLLPLGDRQSEDDDTSKDTAPAVYCSICGRRKRGKENFCPVDGNKY